MCANWDGIKKREQALGNSCDAKVCNMICE